jgi:glycosyltransferase involved in cell wall biosynthesis
VLKIPEISVIIPFYNRVNYIQRALESVFCQDFKNFEIIAIDDGSTDRSAQIVKEFNHIPINLISQENLGAASARNAGIRAARGRFITFLDSDDIWVPNKLSSQLADFHNAGSKLCFGHIQEFISPDFLDHQNYFQTRLIPGYSFITLLMLREDFLQIGELNPLFQLAEFIEWFERSKYKGFSAYMSKSVYAYRRIHQGNIGRAKSSNAKQYLQAIKSSLDQRRLFD